VIYEHRRWIQLSLFVLLALFSYGVYDRYFSQSTNIEYEPFTKGYSLEGVVMKTSDAEGHIVSTIESPAIVHYADTEVSVITKPKYTLHQQNGDWVFTSDEGEISPDQSELYFAGKVDLLLDSKKQDKVSIETSDLRVNVEDKIGKGKGDIQVIKPGLMMTGVGSVINFTDQSIEVLEDLYAEFEN
jgi:LPS export ABC transporter protein LptC